jgi:chromosome partitioning protein
MGLPLALFVVLSIYHYTFFHDSVIVINSVSENQEYPGEYTLISTRHWKNMPVVSFVTQKGGCGKTTLALCLAVAAQQAGKQVVILDTDPQGSAAQWWEGRQEGGPELFAVKGEDIARAVTTAQKSRFDLILIDTPARAEPVNAAAAHEADFCLIPCQPTLINMRAQDPTVQMVKRLERRAAFVLTRCPPRGSRTKEAEHGLQIFGLPVAPVLIGNRTAYPDATGSSLGVTEYEPQGKAAEEVRGLLQWLLRQMEKRS